MPMMTIFSIRDSLDYCIFFIFNNIKLRNNEFNTIIYFTYKKIFSFNNYKDKTITKTIY